MNISLIGKRALVGGSSQGIGKGIGEQLAASGASVTLMARSGEKLKDIISLMPTDNGQQHQYLEVDFTDFNSYQEIIGNYFKNNS
ncbi:MAG: 3-oxoacyl-[acyl-carrier protein] reductase, partial [Sediminicola sp.]